jgi:hypothetical protein
MILNNKITTLIRSSRTGLLVFLLLFMSFSIISGQKSKEDQLPFNEDTRNQAPPFKERLFFGGNFGLMFGTLTDIQVSPVVGYWVLPRVAVAAGPTYRYLKNEFDRTSVYGGKAYVQLVVIQDLNSFIPVGVHTGVFLHTEDELLSLKANFWKYPLNPPGRFYVNTVLAGGGISQQIGRRSSLNFMILWPLNDSNYDIYSKPELRISFTF